MTVCFGYIKLFQEDRNYYLQCLFYPLFHLTSCYN